MTGLRFMLISTGVMLAWIGAFRLPFRSPARRHQIGLWLSDRTGLRADAAFAAFGTVLYLGLGMLILLLLNWSTPIPWSSFGQVRSAAVIPLTLLGIAGTSSLNALCMSIFYRVNPHADVPGEVARIQWIASTLALPRPVRWLVPALAAMVEELVFRGAIFLGIGAAGGSLWEAIVFSTVLFAAGQVLMVSTRTQVLIMAVSSCTLGFVGTLLVAASGSIVPALIVHMSFAGFYTNMSATGTRINGSRRRWSL